MDLLNNQITIIRKGDFDKLWNLRFLNVFKSYLSTVEEGSLRVLKNLLGLDLGFARLTEVPKELSFMPQLVFVALEYNQITEVPVDVLHPLVNLQEVIFTKNQLVSIPELQFLPRLIFLNLEANNVTSLPKNLFGHLEHPCALWIDDNPVSDIAAATLLALPHGSEIRISVSVKIWAKDKVQRRELLGRSWHVYNSDMEETEFLNLIHTCDEPHQTPSHLVHPCDM